MNHLDYYPFNSPGLVTQKDFVVGTLNCAIIRVNAGFMGRGHYCGYVEVPVSHPLHNSGYDGVPSELHDLVNGGLTFSEDSAFGTVFGFDTAHSFNWNNPYSFEQTLADVKLLAEGLANYKHKEQLVSEE